MNLFDHADPPPPPQIIHGDCGEIIRRGEIEGKSVNLIVTSPPYADRRKKNYGGVHPDEYVEWFFPLSEQFKSVLADDGSFVLNIKENVVDGERHRYVMDLVLALREQGWLYVDDYIWHKKTAYPGKWPNRFRDAWEHCFHFTLGMRFKMRQDAVMVPLGKTARSELRKWSRADQAHDERKLSKSPTKSGFHSNLETWRRGRDVAYPTNVLHMAAECRNKGHPAVFPVALPSWFIKLFTDEGDVVLDPFAGSGSTLVAARDLRRIGIGIDMSREYCDLMQRRVGG